MCNCRHLVAKAECILYTLQYAYNTNDYEIICFNQYLIYANNVKGPWKSNIHNSTERGILEID